MALFRSCALAATLLALAIAPSWAQDIGGLYQVDGTNLDGTAYSGTAQIDLTTNTTCRIMWDTGSTSEGICMRYANAFAAAYIFDNGEVGLLIYEVLDDGTLDGTWTIADIEGAGTEILTPLN